LRAELNRDFASKVIPGRAPSRESGIQAAVKMGKGRLDSGFAQERAPE
jgi:hypothetical protein